jgi:hypothetical protein
MFCQSPCADKSAVKLIVVQFVAIVGLLLTLLGTEYQRNNYYYYYYYCLLGCDNTHQCFGGNCCVYRQDRRSCRAGNEGAVEE